MSNPLLRDAFFTNKVKAHFILVLLLCSAALACSTRPRTQRVVAGRTIEGRYIAPDAYAAVMAAELLAAQGLTERAYAAYQEAQEHANYSPLVWTRLGALGCQLKLSDYADAFAHAEALDPQHEALWQARARCALSRGEAQEALSAAERATAINPKAAENTVLVSAALRRLRRPQEATHWQQAFALSLLHPIPIPGAPPIHPSPNPQGVDPAPQDQQRSALNELNQALHRADLPKARRLALTLNVDPIHLALHALELGLPAVALQQAQLVLSANPLNADARVVALASADLLHDNIRFQALLIAPTGSSSLRPSAQAALLRLLARRSLLSEAPSPTAQAH